MIVRLAPLMLHWQRRFVVTLFVGVVLFVVGAFAPAFHLCRKDWIQGGPIRGSGLCNVYLALEMGGLILLFVTPIFLIILSIVRKRRRVQCTSSTSNSSEEI